MNIRERISKEIPAEVQADINRIMEIWREPREKFGRSGPFLFGHFTSADAVYAPVVARFVTYGVQADPISTAFMDAILAQPAVKEWIAAAREEQEVVV